MVAGGISSHGPGKLVFISGNQDSKAYEKMLKFFKEDIDFINKKCNVDLLFQQDNAPTHTSGESMKIIKDLFYKTADLTNIEIAYKPSKCPSKSANQTKEHYNLVKEGYNKLNIKYAEYQRLIEERQKSLNKEQVAILKWPANSPVNYLLILGFKSK